jgi:serine/threonine protein kinase
MPPRTLKCTCGHSWEHDRPDPLPADLAEICPVCTAARERTLDQPNPPPAPAARTVPRLRPGQVLAGYEILEELNHGGMGVIYKARQPGLNRLVALKVIVPERLGRPEILRRFRREVQAAALLSHPNIVTVYHTDLDGPCPYLAMEYVPGIDLFRLVKRTGPLAVADACRYIREAAVGLQHAHEQGLVHRDIKPHNLMVTPSPLDPPATPARPPRVKILDMGLARVVNPEEAGEAVTSLTQAGEFLGTPDYISPEQAEDPRNADVRSDLYSLGCTFYFLLTGLVPFPGANLVQKLRRQLTEAPPAAAPRRPEVFPELDALLQRLMARDPADRFQTPADLIDALDNLRPGSGVTAVPAAQSTVAAGPAPTLAGSSSSWTAAKEVEAHPGGVIVLSLSPDGRLLLSGGLDETLRLWDADRLREQASVAGEVGPVQDACLAPGGRWAASCALKLFFQDRLVQLWDLAGGRELRRLKGHAHRVFAVAVAPDGRRVASGGADQTVRLWSVDQPGSPSVVLNGHTDAVSRLTFLPGGDQLLSASHDGTVRLWDGKTGAAKGQLPGGVGKVLAVAFGGPSRRIAMAGDGLRVRQANGSFTALAGHRGVVLCVAFTPDGQRLLSGGSDGTVRLWRVEDGEELRCYEGHAGKVHAVAVGPDGKTAFSGSAGGTIRRWSLPA